MSPKALIVEAEARDVDALTEGLSIPGGLVTHHERLQELSDVAIPEGVAILSPFIYSRVDREQLERLPALEFIATRSTGYDHIDLDACRERGIVVSNVPEYGDTTVAEHTFALILALTRKVHRTYERTVRGDFSIEGLRGRDLFGKTFGAIGTGKIGIRALRIANGFGMRCLAYDVYPRPELAESVGFVYVDFDELLERSDVLSIHVPYNRRTHHLIDAKALARMPPGAILINTSRGAIVDTQALLHALNDGKLAGAGLDVIEAEALITEEAELLSSRYDLETLRSAIRSQALLRLPNVIITPHIGFNSEEAVARIVETTRDNIRAYLEGEPRNVVS